MHSLTQKTSLSTLIGQNVQLFSKRGIFPGRLCHRQENTYEVRVKDSKDKQRIVFEEQHVESFDNQEIWIK